MAELAGSALMSGFHELLKTGQFSDLLIKSGDDREFNVHKILLFTQSSWFRAALGGDFKEARTNKITLPEPANVIQALIHHFYHLSWDENARGETCKAVFCVQVYQVADKYDVPPLRALAAAHFERSCESPLLDIPSFVDAICAVDECTSPNDRTLWRVLIPLIKTNMVELLEHDEFKELLKDKEELNFELLRLFALDRKAQQEQDEFLQGMLGNRMVSDCGPLPCFDFSADPNRGW